MICIICMSAQLNIRGVTCINRQHRQKCIKFDNDAWVLLNFYSQYSKTRTISNTWLVQTKFNMSGQRVSVCRANAEGKKHLSQSVRPVLSVALSKLVKTDLVFVQPGAKINSVYYCENVLEQGLLPAIHRISNNSFVFKQNGAPCTPLTTLSLTCIPMCLRSLNQKTGRRKVQI